MEPANQPLLIDADKIYVPHRNQLLIHTDPHRYRVVICGRRFGKSALAINEGLAHILSPTIKDQMVWIILPEYEQAYKTYWVNPRINKYFLPYTQSGILKKDDTRKSLFNPATNSRLMFIGADDPDSLRGSGLDLIIWDEAADVKPSAFDIISPTLADSPNHRIIYMGTPDGYNHFHDFALMGDHAGKEERAGKDITVDDDYITYHFTSYDNLMWAEGTPERIAFVNYLNKERKKYYEIGQGDWFEQEYMAQFRKRAGAVHPMFDRTIHYIPTFTVPHEWRRVRGFDFGSSHPTASVRLAIDNDDNHFIEVCYKQKESYISNHAEAIKKQDADFNGVIAGYGDPSGKQWISEFNKEGLSIVAAKKSAKTKDISWIQLGIDKINELLAPKEGHLVLLPDGRHIENAPSLFILIRTENQDMVDEFETLVYKKDSEGLNRNEIDDTQDRKGHYDLHASLRYEIVSEDSDVSYAVVQLPSRVTELKPMPTEPVKPMEEDERKRLEKQADLEIMRNEQRMRSW